VKKFLVKRRQPRHAGELLAVLENQDLTPRHHNHGALEQPRHLSDDNLRAGLPEDLQKIKGDMEAATKKCSTPKEKALHEPPGVIRSRRPT